MEAAIENKSGLSHYRKIEQLKPKHPQRAGKHIIAYSLENNKNRRKKTMLYEQGKTMQLLGKQYYNTMCDSQIYKELLEVAAAHIKEYKVILEEQTLVQALLDAYILGFIYGKRAERAKKK